MRGHRARRSNKMMASTTLMAFLRVFYPSNCLIKLAKGLQLGKRMRTLCRSHSFLRLTTVSRNDSSQSASVATVRCTGRLPWWRARGSGCAPVSCRHPVKNVTAGNEMAAPGHHSPLFFTEIEHKLHPGSHDGSPNVRFQSHFLHSVASEKINKEYV